MLEGGRLAPGTHVINVGVGRPDLAIDDEYLAWGAELAPKRRKAHGVALPGKVVYLAELLEGRKSAALRRPR